VDIVLHIARATKKIILAPVATSSDSRYGYNIVVGQIHSSIFG